MTAIARRLLQDENGGAITEYAIVIGLVILAAVAVIAQFGTRVLARWSSVDSKLGQTKTVTVIH